MSEDNNQNLKEKEVTLNLTEEELEEYKTYLKFKNKLEEQEGSQEPIRNNVESVEEVTTKDNLNPNHTFSVEQLRMIGYKEYFMKPIDEYQTESSLVLMTILISIHFTSLCAFYYSTWHLKSFVWSVLKIIVFIGTLIFIYACIQWRNNERKRCLLNPQIKKYNELINGANWIKISTNDKTFEKYYGIAKDTITNKLYLEYKNPQFINDAYTELYQIADNDVFIVFGIYSGVANFKTFGVAFMIVIENEESFLSIVGRNIS